jgi:hypothetical protein
MRASLVPLTALLCVLSTPALSTPALAFDTVPRQPGKFGLGLGGGTRTSGLSGKYTFTKEFSLQGLVGTDSRRAYGGDGTLAMALSALVEMPALHEDDDIEVAWCVGAGPFMAVGDQFWLGAHAVIGLELNLRVIPLEFTIEYRPSFEIVGPDNGLELVDFGGHLRWWF